VPKTTVFDTSAQKAKWSVKTRPHAYTSRFSYPWHDAQHALSVSASLPLGLGLLALLA
jgi:hypothetical protein